MRVLITGGNGYIGSVLTPALLKSGFKVSVLDLFERNVTSLLPLANNPNFKAIKGDCRDSKVVGLAVRDADIVIPLAALVGAPLCAARPFDAQSVNLEAIKLLTSLTSQSQKIIFPTTNSGYGTASDIEICDEESPLRPISTYGVTKMEAEKVILDRGNAVSFRLATVFGISPTMRLDLIVNEFCYRAVKDRVLVLFEGHFRRNFVSINDVCAAFEFACVNFEKIKDNTFNLGHDGSNMTKIDLAALVVAVCKDRLGIDVTLINSEIGQDPDKRDYLVSNKKLAKNGFSASEHVKIGCEKLIDIMQIFPKNIFGNI